MSNKKERGTGDEGRASYNQSFKILNSKSKIFLPANKREKREMIFPGFYLFRVFSRLFAGKVSLPLVIQAPLVLSKNFNISLLILSILLLAFFPANAQNDDLPDKIRGYKVHKAKISVRTADERTAEKKEDNEAFIKIGEPDLSSVGLTGVTFELSAEIDSVEQSGTVDFLTFNDFRVNGISVNIEEYTESFDFKKNEPINLPKPIRIRVSAPQTLLGAVKELGDSQEKWRVTGRVFVFGRFKKAGFKFKRVVPVDIDVWITNPVRD